MTVAVSILDRAGEDLGGFLPRLAGAVALFLLGILLARIIGRLAGKALDAAGLDDFANRFGVGETLQRAGLGDSLSRLVGRALRIGLTLVVIFAALSLLGLQFLDESLNAGVLFLPKLLVAAALVLVGVVAGALARDATDRLTHQMDLPLPLGRIVQVAVVAIFAITAAAQIAVSTVILMVLVGTMLAAVAATLALAFGLGGQGLARELSAGRYVRGAFKPGQELSFGDVRGEVVEIETAATVLRTPNGQTVRVPNDLLLTSVVTVHEPRPSIASPIQ